MKSYLSLIPISAKVHKRQNRMTILCIIFSVFLVTAIFSMAEMGIRMEQTRLVNKHGDLTLQDIISSTTGQTLCITAIVFFVLVLSAGVLMISSSINSSVTQRTKFFGMMRCIGMSKQQIIHFVKLEALHWCKTAIPIGVTLGIVITWGLCAVLRFLVGEEFSDIPLFGISIAGIISGMIVGIAAVLLAARTPAKRAAKVSPVTAASGNSEITGNRNHGAKFHLFKIETALGIHHAAAAKKTLILMTGSFALSIILFLSFSVLVEFVGYIMPQSAATADMNISSGDVLSGIDRGLLDTIGAMDGVKRIFGRRSVFNIPAQLNSNAVELDMISYDDFDLDCLVKDDMLKKGSDISKVYGNSPYVLATWDKGSSLEIGDKLLIADEEFEIAGLLKYDPFSSDGLTNGQITLITSGDTFIRLTGITDYSLIMIQTTSDITDEDVTAIRDVLDHDCTLNDLRGQRTSGTYLAFVSCIYAFLAMIALVTVLNIVNSISMSVSSKIKSYGAMRAVGMSEHQITKMIAAEAFTYALLGGLIGSIVGLILYRLLYNVLIGAHFGYAIWSLPTIPLGIILLFVCMAAIIAAYIPAKRIHNMAIAETINEL
ncbi:MAG: FtsX-like permease family protein [Lachnospiraceae bacterium]|jgi:putative ABC transport system permease protein|nr:FtsX-like permease family protein [Lachnospiraceae bacterium]